MRNIIVLAALFLALASSQAPQQARACGGFFCGQQPVDQTAERIIFAVGENSTTMIVQIAYQGSAEDFAWVLPLGAVPEADSLATFPQLAMAGLDAQTGPQFLMPEDCYYGGGRFSAAQGDRNNSAGPPPTEPEVIVHIRETVGPFDVAVIESDDPGALIGWLQDNSFRVTAAMEPYIAIYTREEMKFLALRLQPGEGVSDIEPFRFTLPGTSPSVPLRMTALASEPEMGIAVFLLGDMRYGPANWPNLEIDDAEIVWNADSWPMQTNWAALVARGVDEAGGQGWVTEAAASTAPYVDLLRNSFASTPEQERATAELLALMEQHPYMTRLYSRLSAEEMTSDPMFRRAAGGDVDRTHQLPRYVEGRDICDMEYGITRPSTRPCDFATCGAGGLCREVEQADGRLVAGCACVPGATARTTFDPSGAPTVTCQDMRMSFMNPGVDESGIRIADPCVGFSCGGGGSCVAMNLTPTCVCGRGLVAVGSLDADGGRQTRCTTPIDYIPARFYEQRLPSRPTTLPAGRIVEVPPPVRVLQGGDCAVGGSTSGSVFGWSALGVVGALLLSRRRKS